MYLRGETKSQKHFLYQLISNCSRGVIGNGKNKQGCKDQESIQPSTTPDPGHQSESDKLTVDTTNESQEVSPLPAGDHKAHKTVAHKTQQTQDRTKTQKIHKRSTALERSVKYFTGGLKPV